MDIFDGQQGGTGERRQEPGHPLIEALLLLAGFGHLGRRQVRPSNGNIGKQAANLGQPDGGQIQPGNVQGRQQPTEGFLYKARFADASFPMEQDDPSHPHGCTGQGGRQAGQFLLPAHQGRGGSPCEASGGGLLMGYVSARRLPPG